LRPNAANGMRVLIHLRMRASLGFGFMYGGVKVSPAESV